MIEIVTIRCFRCKKVVDKVRVEYDHLRMAHRVEVECHGEIDVCHVGDHFLAHADRTALKDLEGVAFAPKETPLPSLTKALTHVG